MDTKQNIEKTEALIDALRATCANYGLSGDSSEYKIIVQVFLYKFVSLPRSLKIYSTNF